MYNLQVTVVKCKHLNHTELESNQEDYFCLEYGSSRYHTRTCKDGEKFEFALFEDSMEIAISVYSNNSFRKGEFVGRGRVQLQRVISYGYDDTTWPIYSENGRTTGEVCLMLCCPNPYYSVGNGSDSNRRVKRPLLFENEDLGRNSMRRKFTSEVESSPMQSAELLDIAMDEFLDIRSPTALDEDTEMGCGSQLPSHSYSTMWDTICF